MRLIILDPALNDSPSCEYMTFAAQKGAARCDACILSSQYFADRFFGARPSRILIVQHDTNLGATQYLLISSTAGLSGLLNLQHSIPRPV